MKKLLIVLSVLLLITTGCVNNEAKPAAPEQDKELPASDNNPAENVEVQKNNAVFSPVKSQDSIVVKEETIIATEGKKERMVFQLSG